MGRPRKRRRRSHGSAWHWKQTDCWYCTLPAAKNWIPPRDEVGQRMHGTDNQTAAYMASARLKIAGGAGFEAAFNGQGEWLVARVASDYIQYFIVPATPMRNPDSRRRVARWDSVQIAESQTGSCWQTVRFDPSLDLESVERGPLDLKVTGSNPVPDAQVTVEHLRKAAITPTGPIPILPHEKRAAESEAVAKQKAQQDTAALAGMVTQAVGETVKNTENLQVCASTCRSVQEMKMTPTGLEPVLPA